MKITLKSLEESDTAKIQPFTVSCERCKVRKMCLPASLNNEEVKQLDGIIERKHLLHRNEYLFREGSKLDSLYVVRTGVLKVCKTAFADKVQITGFFFPGQLLGLDGIGNGIHPSSAIALETSAICQIPYTSLESLSARIPNLLLRMYRSLSREIIEDQQLITLLGKNTARERVAALLIRLINHNVNQRLSDSHIRLPMKRVDIANHLGLTEETVSRTFSHLEKLKILNVTKREIVILDAHALLKGRQSRNAESLPLQGQGL